MAPDPAPPLLQPGTQLGKYQLLRRLAVGGMAEIYLARQAGIAGFEKHVVLKRILPQHAENDDFIAMFLDEARIAATLHHPNVGQVFDIGQEGGSYYFTMEYVHGEDMRRVLKGAAKSGAGFPVALACQVIMGLASGLHYAHDKLGPDNKPLNIVHRDVSPSNVLVSYDGQIKLVDFGIAKAASRQAESRVGTIKGKVSYMSPEQCQGKPLDRRTDIFALGILLYEFTTGTRLFKGENELAVLNQIVWEDVPPPSKRRPGYAPDLEAIVMKALAKNREDRYATAQDLQGDVEAFAREHKLATSPIEMARYMERVFGKKEEPWRSLADTPHEPVPEPPRPSETTPASGGVVMIEKETVSGHAAAQAGHKVESDSAIVAAEWAGASGVSSGRRRSWAFGVVALLLVGGAVAAVVALRGNGGSGEGGRAKPTAGDGQGLPLGGHQPSPSPSATPSPTPSPSPSPSLSPSPSPTPAIAASTPDAGVVAAKPTPRPSPGVSGRPKKPPKPEPTPTPVVVKPDPKPTPEPTPVVKPEPSPKWDPDSPLPP